LELRSLERHPRAGL